MKEELQSTAQPGSRIESQRRVSSFFQVAYTVAKASCADLFRKKIIWVTVLFAIAYVGVVALMIHAVSRGETRGLAPLQTRGLLDLVLELGLYVGAVLSSAIGILLACGLIAGDIEAGTIEALLSAPIGRSVIIWGKLAASFALIIGFFVAIEGGVLASYYFAGAFVPGHLLGGLTILWLGVLAPVCATLLLSSLLPTIATAGCVSALLAASIAGGWLEIYGASHHYAIAVTLGILANLCMPSQSLFLQGSVYMQSPLLRTVGFDIFPANAQISPTLVCYGCIYVMLTCLTLMYAFRRRDI